MVETGHCHINDPGSSIGRHKALDYSFIKFDRIQKCEKKKKRYSVDISQEFYGLKKVTETVFFSIKPLRIEGFITLLVL